jgi:hypothetical protein
MDRAPLRESPAHRPRRVSHRGTRQAAHIVWKYRRLTAAGDKKAVHAWQFAAAAGVPAVSHRKTTEAPAERLATR